MIHKRVTGLMFGYLFKNNSVDVRMGDYIFTYNSVKAFFIVGHYRHALSVNGYHHNQSCDWVSGQLPMKVVREFFMGAVRSERV